MEDRDRGRWGPRQSRAWAAAVGTESDALLGTMRSHWGSDMNPVMSLKALWAPLGLHRVGGPGEGGGGGREALRRPVCLGGGMERLDLGVAVGRDRGQIW